MYIKAELRNLYIKQKAILFLVVYVFYASISILLAVKAQPPVPQDYLAYINNLSGPMTLEKETYIISEQDKINEAIYQCDSLVEDLRKGRIQNYSDFKVQIGGLSILAAKKTAIEQIVRMRDRIYADVSQRYFIDSRGWEVLICQDNMDMLLLLFILIVVSKYFLMDYEAGVINIVRVRENRNLRRAKYAVCVSYTLNLILVSSIFRYKIVEITLGLKDRVFPLQSLSYYGNCPYSVNIAGAAALLLCFKVIGAMAFSALVILLSVIFKRSQFVFTPIAALSLLQYYPMRDTTLIYLIPLPYGLIRGAGYLRGHVVSEVGSSAGQVIMFEGVELGTLLFIISVSIVFVASSFVVYTYAYSSSIKRNRRFILAFLCVFALILQGCTPDITNESTKSLFYNERYDENENHIFILGDQGITAIDKRTDEFIEIMHNPFSQIQANERVISL